MRKIGITTTIPVEIIFAANCCPVDLNNIFITSEDPVEYIDFAESHGFPRTICSWIKGIYSTVKKNNIKEVVAVMEGDCSNTHALSEILFENGVKIIPFSYPSYSRDKSFLKKNIEFLMNYFKTDYDAVNKTKKKLDNIRKKLHTLDDLTYKKNIITGFENHLFLVSSSDFMSDFVIFENKLDNFLKVALKRKPFNEKVRLGVVGVPPIIYDFYEQIEKLKARVVFNEVQRQFAMLDSIGENLVEKYFNFTYPYSIFERINDIQKQIKKRKIDGIIHYVQSFCHRTIQDSLLRKHINVPILTIEGDRPSNLDERNKIRIESFIDMLLMKKKGGINA